MASVERRIHRENDESLILPSAKVALRTVHSNQGNHRELIRYIQETQYLGSGVYIYFTKMSLQPFYRVGSIALLVDSLSFRLNLKEDDQLLDHSA